MNFRRFSLLHGGFSCCHQSGKYTNREFLLYHHMAEGKERFLIHTGRIYNFSGVLHGQGDGDRLVLILR